MARYEPIVLRDARKIIKDFASSHGCRYRITRTGEVHFYGNLLDSGLCRHGWYLIGRRKHHGWFLIGYHWESLATAIRLDCLWQASGYKSLNGSL